MGLGSRCGRWWAMGPGNHEPPSVGDVEGPGGGGPWRSGAAGDLDDAAEGRGIADRDVGEGLAVQVHVGLLQAGGRVDPGDPQLAHVALALLAVPGRVGERVELRLPGALDELAVGALAA